MRCAGRCPLWHWGSTSSRNPRGCHVPPRPREPRDGSVPVASGCSRLDNVPAGRGLPCGGRGECRRPQCNSPAVRAAHGHARLPLPPPPHPHPQPRRPLGARPGRGWQLPRGSCSSSPAHAVERGPKGAWGGHIQLPSGGAELPEPCQHRLLLWETTSCQGRNLAALQTSTGATGISLQRLFFRVIYFQVWSVRTIPCLEVVGFFFTAIMTVRKRL